MKDSGYLTTHVLDIMSGEPARGLKIELFAINGKQQDLLASAITNSDGRCEKPLLAGDNFKQGAYQILFHVGDYFDKKGIVLENGQFLDIVPVNFIIADEGAHYHVPLLVSPYGYSTYRGS